MKRTLCLLFALLLLLPDAGANPSDKRRKRNRPQVERQAAALRPEMTEPEPETEITEEVPAPNSCSYDVHLPTDLTPAQTDSLVAVWREQQTLCAFDRFFSDYIDPASAAPSVDTPDSVFIGRLRSLASPVQLPYNPIV